MAVSLLGSVEATDAADDEFRLVAATFKTAALFLLR
jgi:hypothetical protein